MTAPRYDPSMGEYALKQEAVQVTVKGRLRVRDPAHAGKGFCPGCLRRLGWVEYQNRGKVALTHELGALIASENICQDCADLVADGKLVL